MSDSYLDSKSGYSIKTAQAHLKKGSCCKCGCLHCPYGFTLKKFGLEVLKFKEEDKEQAQAIYDGYKSSVTQSLLSSAFGNQGQVKLSDYHFIYLKGYLCGICLVKGQTITELLLHPQFNNQGITKSIVEVYL